MLPEPAACRSGSIEPLTMTRNWTERLLVDCQEQCSSPERHMLRKLALVQGIFYLATGIWPLIDIASFQMVTGPKTDLWLVRTVGVLVSVVGVVLLLGFRNRRVSDELLVLAVGCALGLAGIDLIYALSGRISAVYLGDAAVELALAGLWGFARLRR
jgi:hypothetical protein